MVRTFDQSQGDQLFTTVAQEERGQARWNLEGLPPIIA